MTKACAVRRITASILDHDKFSWLGNDPTSDDERSCACGRMAHLEERHKRTGCGKRAEPELLEDAFPHAQRRLAPKPDVTAKAA